MRAHEDYSRHITLALILTLAILVLFQVYILREPDRISGVEAHDKTVAVTAGQALFQQDCTLCHGNNGEGTEGRPALNDKKFLDSTSDDRIFSIIGSGVPNSEMPAWGQSHGGPLTDEDITNLVSFLRAWQPTAPDRSNTVPVGDSTRGRTLFTDICAVCHGENGVGTDRAPALNDPAQLTQFDDAWYRDVISNGRPAKGMPTWGTVLSPQQVSNIIAVIDIWRSNAAATPIPTEAAPEIARPSNPGGAGQAVNLAGDAQSGAQIFVANCQKCHGASGLGGVSNPGSDDGTVPPLNPIDDTLISADLMTYAINLDLFVEHGSTPAGTNPQQVMPAWGDDKKLTPQQIADVIAYVISLNPPPQATVEATAAPTETAAATAQAAPTETTAATPEAAPEIARPSNPGGAGQAVNLAGDVQSGAQIFVANCQKCHGASGLGGVSNPGSDDGTVPPLNPIDDTLISADLVTYITNLDLFVEHGSTPAGTNPQQVMPAWGDDKKLTPQQIADVIAYVISLNPPPQATAEATAAPTETAATAEAAPTETTAATPEAASEIARPSNPGGAGQAVNLTGDAQSGAQIFVANCQKCHGASGLGGVSNPGSDDGTVPPLNPIDDTLISADLVTYITNLDLFVEHGSTPAGTNPQQVMPAWGDDKKLTPQQIADVIAYVISLNKP